MKRLVETMRELRAVTWLRLLAIMGTVVFVAVMCLMEQIRRLLA